MTVTAPHYLLFAEAAQAAACDDSAATGWRFVLRLPTGETELEADDLEPAASVDRLELLAVVRGLEALPQPSRVTLQASSRHLRRGLESGLALWRENDWQWERYGQMSPIKNGDLWRRLDRLTEIHRVECPPARSTPTDDLAAPPVTRQLAGGRNIRIDSPRSQPLAPQPAGRPVPKKRPFAGRERQPQAANDGWLLVADLVRTWIWYPLNNFLRFNRVWGEDYRAHDRFARRHERFARRSPGSPFRRLRAADDPT